MNAGVERQYGVFLGTAAIAWFALAVGASAASMFAGAANEPPVALLSAAILPIAAFLVATAISPGLRDFVLSLDSRIVTAVHTWRAAGFLFLVLASYGILPRLFAWPAGWGDIAIGVTAPLAAVHLAHPEHRRGFVAWHLLGLLDLLVAVSLGASAGVLGYGPAMAPMTVLPLSIVPTFLVPMLFILHLIALGQALRWERGRERGSARMAEGV